MKHEAYPLHERLVAYKPKLRASRLKKEAKIRRNQPKRPLMLPVEPPALQTDEVYCLCRKPFTAQVVQLPHESDAAFQARNLRNKMIGCDTCDEWYHLQCLKLPLDFSPSEWQCPKCLQEPASGCSADQV